MYLNLSSNNFKKEAPKGGVFQNTNAVSVVGGVAERKIPLCSTKVLKDGKASGVRTTIITISMVVSFILASAFIALFWRRKSMMNLSSTVSNVDFLPKVSYRRL